jgi:hypothetical protein
VMAKYRYRLCNLPIRDPDEHLKASHRLLAFSKNAYEIIEVVEDVESEGA